MKLFQLKNIVTGFASINFEDVDMTAVLKEGKTELLDGRSFSWDKSNGDAITDCPFYIGTLPIFDTDKLSDALANTSVKTANISVEGRSYTVIAAPHYKGNAINKQLSEMRCFRSGKIMTIHKYVFNSGLVFPTIFTPEEFVMYTFCDTDMAQKLLECEFSQLIFEECPIK